MHTQVIIRHDSNLVLKQSSLWALVLSFFNAGGAVEVIEIGAMPDGLATEQANDLFVVLDTAESFMRTALADLDNRAIQENHKQWVAVLTDIQNALAKHAPSWSTWHGYDRDRMTMAPLMK